MITFSRLSEEDLELVLSWRTSEHVTKYMYTDISNSLADQKRWFDHINNDQTQYYWMMRYQDVPFGLISLTNYSRLHARAALGFYIGDLNYARLAGYVHAYLYNFAFFELNLRKLTAEVMAGNEGILRIHQHHGFVQKAIFEDHIYKYHAFHNVYYLELSSAKWKQECVKFHKYKAHFDM